MMNSKTMKVGIVSKGEYIKRTIAIAKGVYEPKKNEPKIWFESIKSMAQILSSENQELLEIIVTRQPQSLTELEEISHRSKSNLSRTLKTLEKYGVVKLKKLNGCTVPEVKATDFKVEFGLNLSHPLKKFG